jgi:methylmalonyl-CoA mutase N-terminal domain/subunit
LNECGIIATFPREVSMSENFTHSMIPLKPVYNLEDIRNLDYDTSLNEPGSYPYTRGIRADLHKRRLWIQRELSGEGGPKKSNEQLKYLIEKGQLGIDIIGDGPTNSLIDPDHPMAKHAIGTQGVSLCCLQDFRELYRDLPIDQLPVSNSLAAAFAIVSLYLVARERDLPPDKLRGSLVQAPFYAEDCGYSTHMPFNLRMRLTADSIEFGTREMPKFHSFLEDTYFIREAGLTAVEEMALGFIEIRYVVRELLKRGLDIDSFAPRIAILVDCGMDLFEEIAKIRATRRLFARMMKEEFGARDPRSLAVVIASHTSGLSMTAQQPFNNIVRGALQTLALVLAEVQAVEISAFDEAFRIPSKESHLIGLRTQQVIHCESQVSRVVDPLGGSYLIESLTDDIEKRIREMVLDIESRGDPAELSDKGWFKSFFENAMERYSKEIEEKKLLKVGVNVFQIPDEEDRLLRDVAEEKIEPYRERIEEIKEYKKRRNQSIIRKTLQDVYNKARETDENLMYPIIEATEAGATMGEISGVMRLAYDYPYDPFGMIESPI